MTHHPVEVELKYAATPEALLELAGATALGPATLETGVVNDETDAYLDTAAHHLAAAGWACRLRTRRVAGASRTFVSLKGPPAAAAGALHRRPEVEGPAVDDPDPTSWPASPARDLVDRLRDGDELVPRVMLEQRRFERPVLVDGERIGTLSLDDVTVLHHGEKLGGFGAVELELVTGGDERLLDGLAAALAARPGLVADERSKLEHALALAGAAEGARH